MNYGGNYAGGGGASTLEALLAPGSAKNVPRSNGSAWVAAQLAMSDLSAYGINNLSDVATGTPADGDFLVYDTDGFYSSTKAWAHGESYVDGPKVGTASDAVAGTQQRPPVFLIEGQGWSTSNSESRPVAWGFSVQPLQGASNPSSYLHLMHRVNDGSWDDLFYLTSGGNLTTYSVNTVFTIKSGQQLRAAGDSGGGIANENQLTNGTAAPDATGATLANTPTGIAAANAGWIRMYVGTTAAYVPYWTA